MQFILYLHMFTEFIAFLKYLKKIFFFLLIKN